MCAHDYLMFEHGMMCDLQESHIRSLSGAQFSKCGFVCCSFITKPLSWLNNTKNMVLESLVDGL